MAVTLILGGSGSSDDRGVRRRSLVFLCDTEAEAVSAGESVWNGLGKKPGGHTWEPLESGRFKATVVYEGVPPGEEKDPESEEHFEWVPRRSEEPIEAHPLIDRLVEVYGGTSDENGKVQFPRFMPAGAGADGLPGEGGAGEQTKNPMYGRESYLLKTGIWRWTFFSREYPQEWEDRDGQVTDSVPGGRRTPEGKNWMILFEKATPVGSGDSFGYDVQVDFILSERGGHPPSQAIFAEG